MACRTRFVAPTAMFLLSWGVVAHATDGVVEINHACAISSSGCFSGDSVGYPVTIDGSAGASYVLTGDLIVPDVNTHGILIVSSAISIDLNGFEIRRSGCDENQVSGCLPLPESGTGSGIYSNDSSYRGLSVKNGSIVGMGDRGVYLGGDYSEVRNLRIRWNRTEGIRVDFHSTVSDNVVYYNGGDGIHTTVGAIVTGNNIRDCGGDGIEAGYGSNVSGNVAVGNGGSGIYGVSTGLVIVHNTAHNNMGDGIHTLGDSAVQYNSARLNTGFGLHLSAGDAYLGNVINDNTAGTVSGGFNLGQNFCNSSDTCP